MRHHQLAVLVFFVMPALASAETPKPAPCPGAESHQFDFWIGDWEVRDMGALSGHNSIRPILDGCVLQETWSGVSGSAGSSLNFYDPLRRHWRQFWVWREGTTLELEGDFRDGKMVLEGESLGRNGEKQRNRISWSSNADGSVRQHWQISRDGGVTWKTEFDGEYRRMPKTG
jgi:hypothetical protein